MAYQRITYIPHAVPSPDYPDFPQIFWDPDHGNFILGYDPAHPPGGDDTDLAVNGSVHVEKYYRATEINVSGPPAEPGFGKFYACNDGHPHYRAGNGVDYDLSTGGVTHSAVVRMDTSVKHNLITNPEASPWVIPFTATPYRDNPPFVFPVPGFPGAVQVTREADYWLSYKLPFVSDTLLAGTAVGAYWEKSVNGGLNWTEIVETRSFDCVASADPDSGSVNLPPVEMHFLAGTLLRVKIFEAMDAPNNCSFNGNESPDSNWAWASVEERTLISGGTVFDWPTTKRVYVDIGRVDAYIETGSVQYPFKGIQDAIDASSPGDCFCIAPGIYVENVVIPGDRHIDADPGAILNPVSGDALTIMGTPYSGGNTPMFYRGLNVMASGAGAWVIKVDAVGEGNNPPFVVFMDQLLSAQNYANGIWFKNGSGYFTDAGGMFGDATAPVIGVRVGADTGSSRCMLNAQAYNFSVADGGTLFELYYDNVIDLRGTNLGTGYDGGGSGTATMLTIHGGDEHTYTRFTAMDCTMTSSWGYGIRATGKNVQIQLENNHGDGWENFSAVGLSMESGYLSIKDMAIRAQNCALALSAGLEGSNTIQFDLKDVRLTTAGPSRAAEVTGRADGTFYDCRLFSQGYGLNGGSCFGAAMFHHQGNIIIVDGEMRANSVDPAHAVCELVSGNLYLLGGVDIVSEDMAIPPLATWGGTWLFRGHCNLRGNTLSVIGGMEKPLVSTFGELEIGRIGSQAKILVWTEPNLPPPNIFNPGTVIIWTADAHGPMLYINRGTYLAPVWEYFQTYNAAHSDDWQGGTVPTDVSVALDILAARVTGSTPFELNNDFGPTHHGSVESMCTYNNKLYVGLSNPTVGGTWSEVWAYDGSAWTLSKNFGSHFETVEAMAVHNGKLYAGLGEYGGDAAVYVFDGSSWTASINFGPTVSRVASLCSYDGKLYAGLGDGTDNADIYAFDGSTWSLSCDFGLANNRVHALTVYNGKLYAGLGTVAGAADIWVYDGKEWLLSHDSALNQIRSLAVYNGKLYAGFGEAAGMDQVWEFDGETWALNHAFGPNYIRVEFLAVYNDRLFAGMGNSTSPMMGKIFVYDGKDPSSPNSWVLHHDFNVAQVETLHVYDGKLYAGLGRTDAALYVYSEPLVSQLDEAFIPEKRPFNEQHQYFSRSLSCGMGFGCNGAPPQNSKDIDPAVVYGAGANGLDSAGAMAELVEQVNVMRQALIDNGILRGVLPD